MALVKKSSRTVNETQVFETSRKYSGKPMFRATVEFENSKPKYNYQDGPNAYVQLCVAGRQSMEDWWMTVDDLREIADACNEAIAQLQPYTKPTLTEVK